MKISLALFVVVCITCTSINATRVGIGAFNIKQFGLSKLDKPEVVAILIKVNMCLPWYTCYMLHITCIMLYLSLSLLWRCRRCGICEELTLVEWSRHEPKIAWSQARLPTHASVSFARYSMLNYLRTCCQFVKQKVHGKEEHMHICVKDTVSTQPMTTW